MTGAQIAAWDAVAAVIAYPDNDTYAARVWACAAELESLGLPAAKPIVKLRDAIAGRSLASLQEQYAAAFESDHANTLYLGWHLFEDGPDWAPWLAMLADALDRVGVPRAPELPDHLSRLLMLIAREDETRAKALAELIAAPLDRIRKRLLERGSAFAPLVETAECLLDGCRERATVCRN